MRWRGVRFAVEMAAELELLLKLVLLGAALDLLVNLQQVLHAVRPVNHAFECTALAANQTRIRIKGFIIYLKILGIVHVNIEHMI